MQNMKYLSLMRSANNLGAKKAVSHQSDRAKAICNFGEQQTLTTEKITT